MTSNNNEIKLVVDKREANLLNELITLKESKFPNLVIEEFFLEVGDIVVSDSLVIERKTRNDFESSIIDNRLFLQLTQMQKYPKRVLIVEGNEDYERLHRNAILGAYSAIITKFSTSLLFTKDLESTAEMVYYLAKHEQEENHSLKLVNDKRAFNDSQFCRKIVESFPMIGYENAKELLKEFGTIKRLVNANENELLQVRLFGKKKAKRFLEIVNHFYDPDEDY